MPGFLVPLRRADGSVWGYQYRPDEPRLVDGRQRKYETPRDQPNGIDIPPAIKDLVGDPSVPLFITEGTKKADSAVSHDLPCVALLGVWSWLGTNTVKGKVALPDWRDIALNNGRRVILAYDSDVARKASPQAAMQAIAAYLKSKGARVEFLHLPDDEQKCGLDDYLAAYGADGIMQLVRPEPPETKDGPPRKTAHMRTPVPDQRKEVCAPGDMCAHTPALANTADLLAPAAETVHELGVTGEDRVIKATFLTAVSQVLTEPVSLVVKGTSAGGKSYSSRTTLRLVPEAELYQVSAGSQRSLIFTQEEFSHRTIVMFEATALREIAEQRDGDMTAMLVRTLLSEGQIIYDISERGDDGKMATRRIIKKGPTNLIVTTTADNLHHENETRLLSLTVDESEEQTRAVLRKIAARRNQLDPADPPDLAPWHALFHWLKHHGEHRVYIPYAEYLSETAAASVVRMRRDFGVLLGMIEAHAVLHQATRERDRYQRIVATPADYQAARAILADAFAITSGRKVKEAVRRAVAAVEALGGQESDVTVAQVARHLKRDRTRATRGLKEAADLGYLANREEREGRPARYRLGTEALPEDKPALPETLPDDTRTLAQGAQVSAQVSERCEPVRVCAGGEGDGDDTDAALAILRREFGNVSVIGDWPGGSYGEWENR